MNRPVVLASLMATVLCIPASGSAEEAPARVFVGYLYGPPRDIDYKMYTHLCHAFLTADADGTIHVPRGVEGAELTAKAHAEKVAVLLSLGGWGWDDQFRRIAADPAIEARYVDRVMEVIDRGDYDGIDLDWEYPDTAEEVAGFEALSRHFRERLDSLGQQKGRPMRLTMAASSNAGTLRWLDTAFLTKTYDWINVMTYDMAGDWTDYAGHNAPLFSSSKVRGGKGPSTAATIEFLLDERKLPADKIALGLPLYGRAFAVAWPNAIKSKDAPKVKLPQGDYRELHKLLADGGWERVWESEAKVPWLLAKDRSAVIGYDDAESMTRKTSWAVKKGLRGVFFWQIHGDRLPDGSNPLQAAALRTLRAGQGVKAP